MTDEAVLTLAPLVGSWRLVSVGLTWTDTQERIEPYGPSPVGFMVLVPSGRIMFLIAKRDREPPENATDQAALFNEMLAYTGQVRADGAGRFVTNVDVAWNPAAEVPQARNFVIKGDRLIITTDTQTQQVDLRQVDRRAVADVIWERE